MLVAALDEVVLDVKMGNKFVSATGVDGVEAEEVLLSSRPLDVIFEVEGTDVVESLCC